MNSNCKAVHETFLKDIVDTISFVSDIVSDDLAGDLDQFLGKKRADMSTSSLARKTSNNVLVFPVICSRNLSIDAMMMTAKAIERKCVIMLQLLFSSIQVSSNMSPQEFISQFHKNIKLGNDFDMDEFTDALAKLEGAGIIKVDNRKLQSIKEDMKNIFYEMKSEIPPSLNNSFKVVHEADSTKVTLNKDNLNGTFKPDKRETKTSSKRINAREHKDHNEMFAKQLLDSDIKKANELVPTVMVVNLHYQNPETNEIYKMDDIVIGVKARLIPMDSEDIINHIITKVDDKNWLLQFIRATTRETSFLKDFVFALDKAKIDALSHSRRGSSSPMWKVLERRSMLSKQKRFWGRNNDVMAITTLVMSQEEVDYLKKEDNIDIENYRNIKPVMEAYNFMGVAVIDESLEVAKFLFDTGEGTWENLAFTGLERENNDGGYKKVINLLTKVAR